jgi:hypothetical protein
MALSLIKSNMFILNRFSNKIALNVNISRQFLLIACAFASSPL